jgi:hypothetical protein
LSESKRFRTWAAEYGADPSHADPQQNICFDLEAALGLTETLLARRPRLGMHHLMLVDELVWRRGFPAFVERCCGEVEALKAAVPADKLRKNLKLFADPRVIQKLRAVLAESTQGRSLSLAQLARIGEDASASMRKREISLRERLLWPMDDLAVWDVSEIPKSVSAVKSRGERRGVRRYSIQAGWVLRLFDEAHYRPFMTQHANDLGFVMELTRSGGDEGHASTRHLVARLAETTAAPLTSANPTSPAYAGEARRSSAHGLAAGLIAGRNQGEAEVSRAAGSSFRDERAPLQAAHISGESNRSVDPSTAPSGAAVQRASRSEPDLVPGPRSAVAETNAATLPAPFAGAVPGSGSLAPSRSRTDSVADAPSVVGREVNTLPSAGGESVPVIPADLRIVVNGAEISRAVATVPAVRQGGTEPVSTASPREVSVQVRLNLPPSPSTQPPAAPPLQRSAAPPDPRDAQTTPSHQPPSLKLSPEQVTNPGGVLQKPIAAENPLVSMTIEIVLPAQLGSFSFGITNGSDTLFYRPEIELVPIASELSVFRFADADALFIYRSGGAAFLLGDIEEVSFLASGGFGDDRLQGGDVGDTISGDQGNDSIAGGSGDDVLTGGSGDDVLNGEDGNDTLVGGPGNDTLTGGAGDDLIDASLGHDVVDDGTGADLVLLSGGSDVRVENTADGARDIFRWLSLPTQGSVTPPSAALRHFDVTGAEGDDQLDLAGFEKLVAILFRSEMGGAFVVSSDRQAQEQQVFLLVVTWENAIPADLIEIGPDPDADIRIGQGWSVYDAETGLPFL